jgi:hypothetical protein
LIDLQPKLRRIFYRATTSKSTIKIRILDTSLIPQSRGRPFNAIHAIGIFACPEPQFPSASIRDPVAKSRWQSNPPDLPEVSVAANYNLAPELSINVWSDGYSLPANG